MKIEDIAKIVIEELGNAQKSKNSETENTDEKNSINENIGEKKFNEKKLQDENLLQENSGVEEPYLPGENFENENLSNDNFVNENSMYLNTAGFSDKKINDEILSDGSLNAQNSKSPKPLQKPVQTEKLNDENSADKSLQIKISNENFLKKSQIKDEILSAKTQTAYALNMISMLSNLDINDAFDFNDFNIQKNYEFLDFKDTFMAMQIVSKIKEDELNIKSLESSFYPTISFYAKYDFYGDDKDRYWKSVQDSKKYGYRVGISFTWDIFDGGRKNAQLNRARLENEQNKLKLKAANLKYDKEIMDMRNFKNNEEETLKNLELLSKESKRLKDMSLSLNKNGQSDKITVLNQTINALNKEQSLKENIINAGYNLTKADLIAKQKRWCE